ncbi:hypothetical protein JAAARDRAFT_377954 [Jaapia argillacea MUCL 33604]|uniref:Uncharacterized protein n=1 Tax=Jaapia argillacea MUCL 33604 TaxID=933084 RepID=A0A067QIS5_9AGAM|nr:hypothetical protein JAAARDRAFT_377954 [Jaapia argillacea MUCL 33604]
MGLKSVADLYLYRSTSPSGAVSSCSRSCDPAAAQVFCHVLLSPSAFVLRPPWGTVGCFGKGTNHAQKAVVVNPWADSCNMT